MDINKLSNRIIGAAIEVHETLGPGLLESAYEQCLCHELNLRGLSCFLSLSGDLRPVECEAYSSGVSGKQKKELNFAGFAPPVKLDASICG